MSDEPEDDDLRAQLEVTKHFLEVRHGHALRFGTPGEARECYEAICDLEAALEGDWDVESYWCREQDLLEELKQESREAREEGHEAAVKREEERQNRRKTYERESIFSRLLPGGD